MSRHTRALRIAIPAAALAAALIGAPLAAATPLAGIPQSAPTTVAQPANAQGIIMRDGGVCDPIRHMGC